MNLGIETCVLSSPARPRLRVLMPPSSGKVKVCLNANGIAAGKRGIQDWQGF